MLALPIAVLRLICFCAHVALLLGRILSPCDENFSDDELYNLPIYMALNWGVGPWTTSSQTAAFAASLQRTWEARLSALRSDLWVAIYLSSQHSLKQRRDEQQILSGKVRQSVLAKVNSDYSTSSYSSNSMHSQEHLTKQSEETEVDYLKDMLWNLRTWPLELITWNVTNSHRNDRQPRTYDTSQRCSRSVVVSCDLASLVCFRP